MASKLKDYIRERSDMNTSDRVFDVLSDELRRIADRAIEEARRNERRTVLDRDFAAVLGATARAADQRRRSCGTVRTTGFAFTSTGRDTAVTRGSPLALPNTRPWASPTAVSVAVKFPGSG